MILTFPYHDPTGKLNKAWRRQLPTLHESFDAICLSEVPPTAQSNGDFVRYLESQNCFVFRNAPSTLHGTHSREGLKLALQHAQPQQPIFFGFGDRILFALETDWRASFLQDIENYQSDPFVLFERSEAAWQTHPANSHAIEQMVSRMFEFLHGAPIDLMPCGFIFSYATAQLLLSQSISATTDVWAEWVLLAMKNKIPITRPQVDWLAWKEAYWEQMEPAVLKHQRETSQAETIKRIKMNVPAMLLLTEERFRNL